MARIQPECFVEVMSFTTGNTNYSSAPHLIKNLVYNLNCTLRYGGTTIALFLIKPTNIPLSQRLEARGLNNLKP